MRRAPAALDEVDVLDQLGVARQRAPLLAPLSVAREVALAQRVGGDEQPGPGLRELPVEVAREVLGVPPRPGAQARPFGHAHLLEPAILQRGQHGEQKRKQADRAGHQQPLAFPARSSTEGQRSTRPTAGSPRDELFTLS